MDQQTQTSTQTSTARPEPSGVGVWHSFSVRDTAAMIAWLEAIGFHEHLTVRDQGDPSVVVHAEWLWPHGGETPARAGGGIMFGTDRDDDGAHTVGHAGCYLVVPDDAAVDDVLARAVAAGGTLHAAAETKPYGGRGGTVRDPEGNTWSVGSYQPG